MTKRTLAPIVIIICLLLTIFISNPLFAGEETGGIGMEISQLYNHLAEDKRGNIVVLNVFKESPAQKAGIQIGDVILAINGTKTWKQDFKDLLHNHLRGLANTEIKLKVFRPSTKQIMNLNLTRVPMVY